MTATIDPRSVLAALRPQGERLSEGPTSSRGHRLSISARTGGASCD
jgi:hypothetical protein